MTSAAVETTPLTCDVLVVGSGAAGLAAAVTAAWHGRRVVLVEKDPVFGGASAWSGGWAWLPRNPLARRAGIEEDIEQPRTYLRHELGERYDAARIDAFLEACPHMVAFFERHTHLRFVDGNGIPDMHGDTPGAAEGGHQLVAAPYDARQLGPLLPRLRKTLRETSFMGMPIMAGADLAAFLDLTRSLPAFLHVARRFSSHLWHLLRYGRAMHLVNGVALVARLAKSAEALGVRLIESAPARELLLRDGKVVGALVESAEGLLRIEAGAGRQAAVVLPAQLAQAVVVRVVAQAGAARLSGVDRFEQHFQGQGVAGKRQGHGVPPVLATVAGNSVANGDCGARTGSGWMDSGVLPPRLINDRRRNIRASFSGL